MKTGPIVLIAVAVLAGAEPEAQACAGCSNPSLPTARTGVAALAPREASLALNLTTTTMNVVHSESCPEIGPICQQRDEPPQLHDQQFYVFELRPIVALGLTDVFAFEAQIPFRVVNTDITFRRLDGAPFEPDYEHIHHRDETLVGFGDPWLLGRATGVLGPLGITMRTGFALPLGSTEEDPFARGRAGLPHQHIQFGTGTVYPIFALDAGVALDRVRLGGYGQALVFPYENHYGYQAGNRYSGGISVDVRVIDELRLGVGGDLLNEQPERWNGVVQQDGNVGRTDLLVGGAVSYAFDSVAASVSVRSPVWQHFIETDHDHGGDPGQLTYPAIINLAVATTFGGPEKEPVPKSGVLPSVP